MKNARLSGATLTNTKFTDADLFRARMPNDTVYNGNIAQFGAIE
ncbi:MAG: pentapeptide repeat-containing protein [Dolichospermum sp.]